MTTFAQLPNAASVSPGTKLFTTDYGQVYSNGAQWIPRDSSPVSILFANLPPPFSVPPGTVQYTTDAGSVWNSGVSWSPINAGNIAAVGKIVAQGAVPVIYVCTGSAVSATGTVTGLTTLATRLAVGQPVYGILPALYLASSGPGSAAGIYFGLVAGTTSITFFNNLLTSGPPIAPAVPNAFSGLSGGNFTGQTGAQTAITIPVPANTIGPNGRFRVGYLVSNNNSAGTKSATVAFGGSNALSTGANTTNQSVFQEHCIMNGGITSGTGAQVSPVSASGVQVANANQPSSLSIDTTVAQNFTFILNNNTATDWSQYDYFYIEAYPA